ncbi:MAG: sulfite exporter TauE/SafE family protein [Alphaproteobacteria bacterium]
MPLPDIVPLVLAVCVAALFAGGYVKGVTGMGLPLVAVPVMALVTDVAAVLPVIAIPTVLSNVVQVWQAGRLAEASRRFWPLLLAIAAATWVGTAFVSVADPAVLRVVVGAVVIVLALTSLLQIAPDIPARAERWLGPPVGAATGLLGGLTSIFSPPLAMYLLALRVDRELFVSAMGLGMLTGTVMFTGGLARYALLGPQELVLSALALLPVVGGQWTGALTRRRIGADTFRRAVLAMLLAVGATLVWKSL